MIGIVVVSHSRALASAVVALAEEMVDPERRPTIEVAAGLDEETFGTDAAAVAEAIAAADGGDGVLVLLDLGSAVLSAEMALEFLDPEVAGRVRLSAAPLVEGLVGAVVAAGAGADLATAATEAAQGLVAKSGQLGEADTAAEPTDGGAGAIDGGAVTDEVSREFRVEAAHGLHARPAARLVRVVGAHPEVTVRVRNVDTNAGPVDARSLTGIATLAVRQGHRIEVTASGPGAETLLEDVSRLAAEGFGDGAAAVAGGAPEQLKEEVPPGPTEDRGEAAPRRGPTYGLDAAIGLVHRPDRPVDLGGYRQGTPQEELDALDGALVTARADLAALQEQTATRLGHAQAAIFEAHRALLDDPALQDPVRDSIRAGASAPEAVRDRVEVLRTDFEGLADAYQRDRAQDVTSVGDRLLRALAAVSGSGDGTKTEAAPTRAETDPAEDGWVLVVTELDPAAAVALDVDRTVGILTVTGGATGHGVLLARARGIPVLTGVSEVADVPEGTLVALDVRAARVEVEPGPNVLAEFEELLQRRALERQDMEERAGEPAVTTDGHRVLVKANLGAVTEAAAAVRAGADGSGLVRTEAVFDGWRSAPTVDEQVAAFRKMAEAMGARPLTIRTWDVGGDKPLPFLDLPAEANPFLGVRGVRAFRADPALLVDQLEAVCRVALEHPVRVMFPMVTTVEEVDWALALLAEAAGRRGGGGPAEREAGIPEGLEVGIMIEVPAAALRVRALSARLDFVSVGSNDLTQYVLAAERGNPALSELGDGADPAVLALVRATCAGVADGVSVGLCGVAASDPELAPLLVGLGVTELSATAATVPAVKDVLRRVSLEGARDLAERALRADSAAEVRTLVSALRAGGTGC